MRSGRTARSWSQPQRRPPRGESRWRASGSSQPSRLFFDLLADMAVREVVVDDTDRLQRRIDGRGADDPEAAGREAGRQLDRTTGLRYRLHSLRAVTAGGPD